jgi:hypothetical protein
MESYLKGRGFDQQTGADSTFSPYLSPSTTTIAATSSEKMEVSEETQSQVIYEEEGSPVVEVVSRDDKPVQLIIRFDNGKVLEIDCLY